MNLAELAIRTGIPRRRLRYVLDHELIPGLKIEIADEAGRPRQFGEDAGFGVVCAVRLLDLGLRHDIIRRFLGSLVKVRLRLVPPEGLLFVLQRNCQAIAELGDGRWVRLRIDETDSGWIDAETRATAKKAFQPIGTVALDLAEIRDLVYGRPSMRAKPT